MRIYIVSDEAWPRSERLDGRVWFAAADQCAVGQPQGVSSAIRLLGQLWTSFVSRSVRYVSGLTPFRAFVAAGEQRILSAEGNRAHCALDSVGVDFNTAVIEEAHQPVPAAECIADGLGDRRAAGNLCQRLLEPGPQRFGERFGFLLSNHCLRQCTQQNASVAGPPARFGSARLR